MTDRRALAGAVETAAGPPAPAAGWYAVGFSHELGPGTVMPVRVNGRDLVAFRSGGVVTVLDAHCPHLGAHLGYGGTVVGGTIRCPFHGFRFDGAGACVATGYGTPPPRTATLRAHPVVERDGVALVWADPHDRPPWFDVPERGDSWQLAQTRTFRLRGHPQETTENSVDVGHLAVLHGYDHVREVSPLRTEGASLTVAYAMTRKLLGGTLRSIEAEFAVDVHGLGFSRVDVRIPAFGLHTRQLVLATLTEPGSLCLRIAVGAPRSARRMAPAVLRHLIAPLWMSAFARDVSQDFDVWRHKVYVDRPPLAAGDGPIGRYRHWARQFYDAAAPVTPRHARGVGAASGGRYSWPATAVAPRRPR